MALTQEERLRARLGETIPVGGSDADTMFTDEQITDFLDQGAGGLDAAAYYGWLAKEAELANMVTTRTGQSQRNMSDLRVNAESQRKLYAAAAGFVVEPTTGRTRIGNVVRE